MIHFFRQQSVYYAVQADALSRKDIDKLIWLFAGAEYLNDTSINGLFIGKRLEMVSPWSSNAVEITRNMGIPGINRIERYTQVASTGVDYDPMLEMLFEGLDSAMFDVKTKPQPIRYIEDIIAYNEEEGLALSEVEIEYLESISKSLGRRLTDSEVFGFSQINSEHCRHKIFNGTFIIDGKIMPDSLFSLIKKTTRTHPNSVVSAYKDNVAFIQGPVAELFAPAYPGKPAPYISREAKTVISLKAETHNFPTTVEAFNGAATGSGGEIRDRMAGGRAGIPLAGTAVYMTPYSRTGNNDDMRPWEQIPARPWLYQTPVDILIKASDGASDFGNKFGQPLICGSVLTFEYRGDECVTAYDKVIMLAGGVGYAKEEDALKKTPDPGDLIVVMGGDNYRIGMGGAAVSSADTGQGDKHLELNAVQRSNPEMQKRVSNVIRAMAEVEENPIISIHDHGAGGHLNCLTELVEDTGGIIDIDRLPLGDPGLSFKEILGNESQERMGLVVSSRDKALLEEVSLRERAPFYVVGKVTDDKRFKAYSSSSGEAPVDMSLMHLFGNTPVLKISGKTHIPVYKEFDYDIANWEEYLQQVLRLEAVAAKDWLTNKVDRCVTGRIAKQQTCGVLQLPLNNAGVVALDYLGKEGIATSIGHAPVAGLIDAGVGSRLSVAEALTNLVWAPLHDGLKSVSLSANWMWPAGSERENARLYAAVKALSDFVLELGINVPTGKDSLSMTQRYEDSEVSAPGTVIVSATAHCDAISEVVEPVLLDEDSALYYVDVSAASRQLGGSSLSQIFRAVGVKAPDVKDPELLVRTFETVQKLIKNKQVIAGHDIGSGGLITTLLEMCFPSTGMGMDLNLDVFEEEDLVKILFAENPGVVIQVLPEAEKVLMDNQLHFYKLGTPKPGKNLNIRHAGREYHLDIGYYRDIWFETSYLLDCHQSGKEKAKQRFDNLTKAPLQFIFPKPFSGDKTSKQAIKAPPVAGVLREQGSNSEREMAYALHLAGFEVRDIHMSDIITGKEDLDDVDFLVAVGGFSNSDVLGSAKGWAGSFLYNETAKTALDNFYKRDDTLSLGVCNGCQLFVELGLLTPDHEEKPRMLHNDSGKFECIFTSVEILPNHTVMLSSLAGSKLGIWAAHGEGKFSFPYEEERYHIPGKYAYDSYPANPNGSQYNAAMLASADGRHLAMMPHLERSLFPWNWGYYPKDRNNDVLTPWILAFENAYNWLIHNKY